MAPLRDSRRQGFKGHDLTNGAGIDYAKIRWQNFCSDANWIFQFD